MCTVHKVINPKSNINIGDGYFGSGGYRGLYRATFAVSSFDPIPVAATNIVCYLRLGFVVLDALPFISFVRLFIRDLTRAFEPLH